jgi:PEP-CTERM motif
MAASHTDVRFHGVVFAIRSNATAAKHWDFPVRAVCFMEVKMRLLCKSLALACALAVVPVVTASAATICDLTTQTSCTINGGIFAVEEIHPAGTGVIDSFVRIQDKGSEQGYNTSFRDVQFDEKTDPNHTRDLLLSEVGTTMIGGIEYAAFYLDINEPASGNKEGITLDQLELFTTNLPNRTGYTGVPNTASGALPGTTKIYDLDATGDNLVQLSYNKIGKGSGSSDMVFYLPMDLFTGQYVNLFSQFGEIGGSSVSALKMKSEAGFEEWFTIQQENETPIPEPGTMGLLGVGLLGLARRYQKRAR